MFGELIYLKDLAHELLSEYEEQLLLQQAQSGDPNARERLILCNMRLVYSIVRKYVNADRGITSDDLMADGIVGLHRAIDKYDSAFGTRFSTYAVLWIHNFIQRSECLHHVIRLPEDVRQEVKKINRVKAELESEGLVVTTEAIAQRTQIPIEQIDRIKHFESDVVCALSLDQHIRHDDGIQALSDIVPDPRSEAVYEAIEMEASLEFFLSKLTDEERLIVEGCYGIRMDMSAKEIASRLDVHPRYVYTMLEKVMVRLRRLGKAVRGSPEEIRLAIENPEVIMTEIGDTISLFPQEMKKPGKQRKPKTKKVIDSEPEDTVEQLTLFDL